MGEKKFLFSFGNGGLEKYDVIDNISYLYTISPKDEKEIPDLLNKIITSTFNKVKNDYIEKADGLISIKTSLVPYQDGKLIFHICGDIIKK